MPVPVQHIRLLARLVRKYGGKLVAAAAGEVEPRGPGRPPRGDLAYFELIHLAEWIEDVAKQHRRNGSRKPYIDAGIDAYDLLYGKKGQRDLDKFLKTMKRKRYEGRRALQEARKLALRRKRYFAGLRAKLGSNNRI